MESKANGTNKLAERILADARADAAKTAEEAQHSAAALEEEHAERMNVYTAEAAKKRASQVQGVLDGCRTRASLDGRKTQLAKKRAVIEEAFSRAYAELLALSGEARSNVLRNLLEAEAEGGETVVPASSDRDALKSLVGSMSGKKLALSDTDASIEGGFLLIGSGYEKDCSFRSALAEVRGAEETAVANLLFH